MSTNSTRRRRQLIASLEDKEYRDAFSDQHITNSVPFQIRVLREDRNWTQKELGQRAGMAQETISLLENPNYGRLTLKTLKRLASAFDVGLSVRFVPFSEIVDWTVSLSRETFSAPAFKDDTRLKITELPVDIHRNPVSDNVVWTLASTPTGWIIIGEQANEPRERYVMGARESQVPEANDAIYGETALAAMGGSR